MVDIERIRNDHVVDPDGDPSDPHCVTCSDSSYPIWPCDAAELLSVVDEAEGCISACVRREDALRQELKSAVTFLTAIGADLKDGNTERARLNATIGVSWLNAGIQKSLGDRERHLNV